MTPCEKLPSTTHRVLYVFYRHHVELSRKVRKETPQKPLQLEAKKTYLRTDAKTVLAFFSYATSRFDSPPSSSQSLVVYGDSSLVCGLKFEDAELELEEIPDPKGGKAVLVAYLKGSLAENRLTKNNLQNIIDSYPPLYRDTFQVSSAPPMPYPIKDLRDARVRGAWRIAVGIAGSIHMAMPVFFDPSPSESHDKADLCAGFGKPNNPITRVIQTLKPIKTAFASASTNDKKNTQVVIGAITIMHGTRTESNIYSFIVGTDLHNVVPITLSSHQCDFVLELFKTIVTDKSILSIADKIQLDPILLQVLYVALWGTIRVVRFYKNNYNRVRIPDLLINYDAVYLRDCDDE
ncbi:hypothetical protein HO173_008448 [Letharia columbiana]|uniref:Uncharacterized protein n=1 Tax=Letharia columbiana TaxID=112416 RepID=A0A8H6L2S0_9LECA|nr:uncharacterized protein HO173_008448 [Letharia columbiana]KAF6233324.1 hypothetical protein HO173_008448 [Letharia columbiana]